MTTIDLLQREPLVDDEPTLQTTVVVRTVTDAPPRMVRAVPREDFLNFAGAFVSSLSLAMLLFGRLTSLTGPLGFVVAAFVFFLGIYALLVSLGDDHQAVIDKVMAVVLTSGALLALAALLTVIGFTLLKGREALWNTNLYLEDMSSAGPADPLTTGGILHAIVGTLFIISVAIFLTVPLGISCAVFLNESRGRASRLVRTVVDAMTALPSILAGLFIFATWILVLGFERSSLAASLAVSIMMLPIIIRSADVVLRLVAGNLKEASAALGAPQWRTVWHVVLPTARSGLATSIILGVARGVGETAPVLLTSGFTASLNLNPIENPMVSLPLATFEFVRSPQPAMVARGFATAAVLMILVLILFVLARIMGGNPAGRLTARQSRRLAGRSLKEAARFTSIEQSGT
ncbi:MAG: phosphate ABC transporter permease PstA [Acidimicrobiales bacterium]